MVYAGGLITNGGRFIVCVYLFISAFFSSIFVVRYIYRLVYFEIDVCVYFFRGRFQCLWLLCCAVLCVLFFRCLCTKETYTPKSFGTQRLRHFIQNEHVLRNWWCVCIPKHTRHIAFALSVLAFSLYMYICIWIFGFRITIPPPRNDQLECRNVLTTLTHRYTSAKSLPFACTVSVDGIYFESLLLYVFVCVCVVFPIETLCVLHRRRRRRRSIFFTIKLVPAFTHLYATLFSLFPSSSRISPFACIFTLSHAHAILHSVCISVNVCVCLGRARRMHNVAFFVLVLICKLKHTTAMSILHAICICNKTDDIHT